MAAWASGGKGMAVGRAHWLLGTGRHHPWTQAPGLLAPEALLQPGLC